MANIIDSLQLKKTCIVSFIVMIAATATSISSIKKDNFNWISYLNCAMFGLQDGVINIHTLSTLGFEFEFKS